MILLLTACVLFEPKDVPADTGGATGVETTAPSPDATVTGALVACADETLWTYEAWTDAPVGSARVNTWTVRPDGWDEENVLGVVETSPLGDHLFLQLESGVSPADHTPGANSAFVCGEDDRSDDLVVVVRVYGPDGALDDCAAWGGAVYTLLDDPSGAGGGDVPTNNAVTAAGEISRATCHVLD